MQVASIAEQLASAGMGVVEQVNGEAASGLDALEVGFVLDADARLEPRSSELQPLAAGTGITDPSRLQIAEPANPRRRARTRSEHPWAGPAGSSFPALVGAWAAGAAPLLDPRLVAAPGRRPAADGGDVTTGAMDGPDGRATRAAPTPPAAEVGAEIPSSSDLDAGAWPAAIGPGLEPGRGAPGVVGSGDPVFGANPRSSRSVGAAPESDEPPPGGGTRSAGSPPVPRRPDSGPTGLTSLVSSRLDGQAGPRVDQGSRPEGVVSGADLAGAVHDRPARDAEARFAPEVGIPRPQPVGVAPPPDARLRELSEDASSQAGTPQVPTLGGHRDRFEWAGGRARRAGSVGVGDVVDVPARSAEPAASAEERPTVVDPTIAPPGGHRSSTATPLEALDPGRQPGSTAGLGEADRLLATVAERIRLAVRDRRPSLEATFHDAALGPVRLAVRGLPDGPIEALVVVATESAARALERAAGDTGLRSVDLVGVDVRVRVEPGSVGPTIESRVDHRIEFGHPAPAARPEPSSDGGGRGSGDDRLPERGDVLSRDDGRRGADGDAEWREANPSRVEPSPAARRALGTRLDPGRVGVAGARVVDVRL